MTINTRDELIAAYSNSTPVVYSKSNVASQVVGGYTSLWRVGSSPAAAATPPLTPEYCTKALLGAIPFPNQTAPATSYFGYSRVWFSTSNSNVEIHDRLAHRGGLNGTLTTAQAVGIDLSTINAGGPVPAGRLGAANYSEVTWFLEWTQATGATASNATVNVTYDDNSTGNLSLIAVGGTIGANRAIQLQSAVNDRTIRAVNTIQLSASTGTAGSIAVVASRFITGKSAVLANFHTTFDWAQLGLPQIHNDACLFGMMIAVATSTGTVNFNGRILHG